MQRLPEPHVASCLCSCDVTLACKWNHSSSSTSTSSSSRPKSLSFLQLINLRPLPEHIGAPEINHRLGLCLKLPSCRPSLRLRNEIYLTALHRIRRIAALFKDLCWLYSVFCCLYILFHNNALFAPAACNSLPRTVTDSNSLGTFKSRLKTFLFSLAYHWYWHYLPPALYKSIIIIYYYYKIMQRFSRVAVCHQSY